MLSKNGWRVKIRDKKSWAITIVFILFVLKNYFKVEIPQVDELVDLLMVVLTTWGVFREPE